MKPSTDRSGVPRGQIRVAHPATKVKPRGDVTANVAGAGGTEAADRVADVLALFTTGPAALGVSEIARELGIGKAVIHRILQSLASRSFVVADPRTRAYRLGPGAVALGARALRDLDLRQVARPVLSALRDHTLETTTLSALFGRSRVYLDQYESPQEIKMKVELGRPYPLYAGASSRAILAFLPAATQESIISAGLTPLTPETIGTAVELRRRLAETRATGYATSHGERQDGAGSVAAAVFGMDGDVAGAISVCGPVSRFDATSVERFVPLVLRGAGEISRSLGWTGVVSWSAE
ncbi:MAG TPA: IclR family transcriptional regulator [Jiangellales bacterium]|nr:IclR family transcriptional regulator [Jiangellales bacterium]